MKIIYNETYTFNNNENFRQMVAMKIASERIILLYYYMVGYQFNRIALEDCPNAEIETWINKDCTPLIDDLIDQSYKEG